MVNDVFVGVGALVETAVDCGVEPAWVGSCVAVAVGCDLSAWRVLLNGTRNYRFLGKRLLKLTAVNKEGNQYQERKF